MLSCEPGQVLIEAAISMGRMWVAVPDRDTFCLSKCTIYNLRSSHSQQNRTIRAMNGT